MMVRALLGSRTSFKSIILLAVGASLLLALAASGALVWPLWSSYRYTNQVVELDAALGQVTIALARERGLTATALGFDATASESIQAAVHEARQKASSGLDETLRALATSDAGSVLKGYLQKVQLLRGRVIALRRKIDTALSRPAIERDPELAAAWISAITDLIGACQDLRLAAMRSTRTVDTTFEDLQMLQHFAWSAAEHAGRERAIVGALLSSGEAIHEESSHELLQNRGELVFAWEMAMLLIEVNDTLPDLRTVARAATRRYFVEFEKVRRDVLAAGQEARPYPMTADAWFATSTAAIDSLLTVETAARTAATKYRDRVFVRALAAIAGGAALFVFICVAGTSSLLLFRRCVSDPLRQITRVTRRFARGDYDAALPQLVSGSEVAEVAAAVREFRDDAVERARLKMELQIARDRAEAANRAKTEFLANMSHELRTPLNAIIGFSELIKSQALGPVGNDKYLEYADDVHASGCHLLEIINDVLEMARMEAGMSTLQEEPMDLVEIAALAVRRIEAKARLGKVELRAEGERSLMVLADPAKMVQAITNLLSNAVKFTSPGGHVTIRIRTSRDLGALVEIADTGIGMSASELARVREPFYQTEAVLSRRYGGTGLGLPLSEAIAKLHGGRLEIDSKPGAGTSVRLILPSERLIGQSPLDPSQSGYRERQQAGARGGR